MRSRSTVVALAALLVTSHARGGEPCPDPTGDGTVDVNDLVEVILFWGPCIGCAADLDGSGNVDVDDLVAVVLGWGPCPVDCLTWLPTFGGQQLDGSVCAITVFDDGSGPALYVGGAFDHAGELPAGGVARWDGASWSALGDITFDATVSDLVVFDDGSGPALYAGGSFSGGVMKWDGVSWSPVGALGVVTALAVFDDGGGPVLHAAGSMESLNNIAKWNGSWWETLGNGLDYLPAFALTVFHDGGSSGSDLYVGGAFFGAIGVPGTSELARWNGQSWSALEGGTPSLAVYDLEGIDHGSPGGPALYAGGAFDSAGGVDANRIASWDGSSWSALGSGMSGPGNITSVWALSLFDDGPGDVPALYAGGRFDEAGGTTARNVARWNGTTWTALGAGLDPWVFALAVFDDGSGGGPALYVGGSFIVSPAGDSYLARWGCPPE